MINVRYVHPARLLTKQQTECLTSRYVPVISLADLAELVEGLRTIAYADWSPELNKEISAAMERGELKHMTGVEWLAQRLLTQLEAHRREG